MQDLAPLDWDAPSQAFNGTWPTSPPLDLAQYTGSFYAVLSGYLLASKNRDLVDLTADYPALYYNRFRCDERDMRAMERGFSGRRPAHKHLWGCRVCMQFAGGWAMLRIGGKSLISAELDGDFDSMLSCVETSLPLGLQPIQVEYAATSGSSVSHCLYHGFHFAVINIASQTRLKVTNVDVLRNVHVAHADLDPEILPRSGSTRVQHLRPVWHDARV